MLQRIGLAEPSSSPGGDASSSIGVADRPCVTLPGMTLQVACNALCVLDPELASAGRSCLASAEADVLGRASSTWSLHPVGAERRQFGVREHVRRAVGYPYSPNAVRPSFSIGVLLLVLSALVRLARWQQVGRVLPASGGVE